jgi:hypothetical protein
MKGADKMKKRSVVLLLTLALVMTNLPAASAAFEWPVPEWNIPFVGTMKTPDGFSAVEVKDFRLFIEQEKKDLLTPKKPAATKPKTAKPEKPFPELPADLPPILTETVPTDPDALTKRFLKSDFALYHLSMDDGEAIHSAWFLIARDGDEMPANIDVFKTELAPEQLAKLDELKKWADDNIHKAQYTDAKNKVSLKMLQMLPIQAYNRENGKLWTTAGRAMITVEDMPFAFFARVFALSVNNHLTVGVLGGFDAERPFWDSVVRDLLLNLKETAIPQ